MPPSERYFIGVDVGTGSARAALVTAAGAVQRTCVRPIQTWNPQPDHYEQSSADIWRAVCECVKHVIAEHTDLSTIRGIGFDATCSLVVIGSAGQPLTVSASNDGLADHNIMLWMDHRATAETTAINGTAHRLLRFVGGRTSPEAQCPKMLWLKRHVPATWRDAQHFFDLPDFLTWRSTAAPVRSLCSVVAKFNYDAVEGGWCDEWFEAIGLGELRENGFERIGGCAVQSPGTPIGGGLSAEAAAELGLLAGTPVGASLVDAYAGGLSLFGCRAEEREDGASDLEDDSQEAAFKSRMALICGTSTGHMSIHAEPIWARGAWGPFRGVLFPGQFVHSAGQSCSGILVDHIIRTHPAYADLLKAAGGEHSHAYLNRVLVELAETRGLQKAEYHRLTADLHVWPDFHGNRSPLDDPSLRGMLSGLRMSQDVNDLAVLYLAFVQALAYGTRNILESMQRDGRPPFRSLIMCGGLSKNTVFMQTCADACGMAVLEPHESEMVLLGAAILGAVAAEEYPGLEVATRAMAGRARVVQPRPETSDYHRRKYAVFQRMLCDQRAYREIMVEGN